MSDLINGLFETSGALFVYLSFRQVTRDRAVRGVSWWTTAFFSAWGLWNLYYYPSLEQWASFYGGLAVVTSNVLYLSALLYYRWLERREVCERCGSRERTLMMARLWTCYPCAYGMSDYYDVNGERHSQTLGLKTEDFDDPPACPHCGAMVGACRDWPNCPLGQLVIKV